MRKGKWVPNGPSQQPERKRAQRERKRCQTEPWRSTAQGGKVFYFKGFSPAATAGETVTTSGSWRREKCCRRTLSAAFSTIHEPHKARWMLPRESWTSGFRPDEQCPQKSHPVGTPRDLSTNGCPALRIEAAVPQEPPPTIWRPPNVPAWIDAVQDGHDSADAQGCEQVPRADDLTAFS
jgi:hypothetical protein